MKTVFALLATTTALGAFVALPGVASVCRMEGEGAFCAAVDAATSVPGALWLASNDDDDDDHDDDGHDDDDDDEGGCGDDDDDEGSCATGANPAPSGTVAPPANGLFGTGKAPVVQMN